VGFPNQTPTHGAIVSPDEQSAILNVLKENIIMAAEDMVQIATTSTEDRKRTVTRQLSGTSFLTLEHVGYFVLVVLLPVLLLVGAEVAIQLWENGSSASSGGTILPLAYTLEPVLQYVDTSAAITLTAAFVVLMPLMYVLRRRVAAEYSKRPGYENRVGYKLPIYTALGLLAALTVSSLTVMVGVFLNSLVNIGVSGANIGQMYTQEFLPALLAFAIFGMATWYTLWFAKGKDTSKMFVNVIGLLAAVMAVALLITTLTLNHDTKSINPVQPQNYYPTNNNYLQY
jgi:hypothetical protein